jgi:hypothetical protein
MVDEEATMKEVILTNEQAKLIAESTEPIELRDVAGTVVVKIDPIDALALADHRRRKQSGQPAVAIPGERVRAHLSALQAEWERTGGFDEAHLRKVLAKLRAEDAA